MKDSITQIIEVIAADVMKLSHIVMENNNLKNSALDKNMRVQVKQADNSIVIETLFDNYIDYIEQGRKPMTGKQPPIDALRDWALSRGIPTDNSTLFLISRAIWRDGTESRPILSALEEEIEKAFDEKWADQLFEAITDELTKYFN
ncbi:hypothetical protein GGR21_002872 [Dysgonomonas hofstadii]|uniref:Uncharacterized protein n=1 Tax=Dysgonomonas hofstadii TaxID=637886 RepID=A0A840CS39_9BACT|nr:hypothetical protein [Dysgonomonas hofstadii]MBB4036958.1 hypothetical protein [Dysgonomonas hofstadii]